MRAPTIMALDPSLIATAATVAPSDWDGNWHRVSSALFGHSLPKDASDAERIARASTIATQVCQLARHSNVQSVYLESYAFSKVTTAHSLGELGGILRLELLRAGVELYTVNMGAARKLLLGKVPRSDVKQRVLETWREAGAPLGEKDFDLADSLTILNWAMSELGGYCFAQRAA